MWSETKTWEERLEHSRTKDSRTEDADDLYT